MGISEVTPLFPCSWTSRFFIFVFCFFSLIGDSWGAVCPSRAHHFYCYSCNKHVGYKACVLIIPDIRLFLKDIFPKVKLLSWRILRIVQSVYQNFKDTVNISCTTCCGYDFGVLVNGHPPPHLLPNSLSVMGTFPDPSFLTTPESVTIVQSYPSKISPV